MNLQTVRARRGVIAARQSELASRVATDGRTLSAAEIEEGNCLRIEDQSLEATETFLADLASREASSATPVRAAASAQINRVAPAVLTRTTQAQRNGDAFPGQSWARMNMARITAALLSKEGHETKASEVLATQYPNRPELARIAALSETQRRRFKAAGVEGGATTSGEAGAELLKLDATYTGDFVEYLYSQTLFDRMGFRQVPADITVKGQDGAFTGYFVGEKKPVPVSIGSYSDVTLRRLKAMGLTYLSRDLIERSAPAAEPLFRDGVVQAISQAVDALAFSATAASNGVSPAGLLNGISGSASVGGRPQDLFTDLAYLTGIFVTAKNAGPDLKYVSSKVIANQIAHLLNSETGLPIFGDRVTENGGVLNGKPYLTGDNVTAGNLLLINPSDVWVIGDSGVRVDLSTDATIEADTVPTGEGSGPTAQSASMVSMFQTDMVAIKATRDINWAYRRTSTIVTARKTACKYDGTASTTD